MTDHKDLIARLDGAYLNYEMPKQLAELQDEAQRAIAALVAERDAAVTALREVAIMCRVGMPEYDARDIQGVAESAILAAAQEKP